MKKLLTIRARMISKKELLLQQSGLLLVDDIIVQEVYDNLTISPVGTLYLVMWVADFKVFFLVHVTLFYDSLKGQKLPHSRDSTAFSAITDVEKRRARVWVVEVIADYL
jgi:hypothetical protein